MPGWNWSSTIPEQLPVPHTCPQGHPPSQGRPLHLPRALGMLPSIMENGIPGLQPHPEPTRLALSHPLAAILYKMFLLWQEIRCSGVFRTSYVHKKLMYKWVKKMQTGKLRNGGGGELLWEWKNQQSLLWKLPAGHTGLLWQNDSGLKNPQGHTSSGRRSKE